jgi:hypothetical protein
MPDIRANCTRLKDCHRIVGGIVIVFEVVFENIVRDYRPFDALEGRLVGTGVGSHLEDLFSKMYGAVTRDHCSPVDSGPAPRSDYSRASMPNTLHRLPQQARGFPGSAHFRETSCRRQYQSSMCAAIGDLAGPGKDDRLDTGAARSVVFGWGSHSSSGHLDGPP